MKKLITKFTSILLAVIISVSVLAVPLSASADGFITNYYGVPIDIISSMKNSDDSCSFSQYLVIRFETGNYSVYFWDLHNSSYDNNIDSNKLELFFNYCSFSGGQNDLAHCYRLGFYSDGSYRNVDYAISFGNRLSLGTTDFSSVSNFVDNVIYSSLPIYYNNSCIYDCSKNQSFSIDDLVSVICGSPSSDSNTLYGMYLDRHEETWQAFIQWLIDTGYYTELAQYGLRISISNLSSIADVWWNNKFSPALVWELLKNNGLNSLDMARGFISWFNQKWQLYISHNSVQTIWDTENNKNYHHRAELIEDVTDEDGNITDSTDTSILREILRQIINLPSNFYNLFGGTINNIANNVYALCQYAYDMPDNVSNAIYNNFVDPINEIIESVKNISINGGDNVTNNNNNTNINIDIDNIDETENNFNIAFGDLQLTLENKFSFYKQLTQITDTVQNYNYSSEAPELVFNVGSEIGLPDSDYKIDFSFYEPYREMIRKIIIAVAYISFAIGLLNKLPNIIGGI
ncbi:MAG: hypothetical protein ACI4JM_12670 [Oscillospiraceae bacterium]